jgi:DnaJ-class molecular chaperone
MGDACRTCDGIGTIRVRTRSGMAKDRIPCPACGGCGHQHPRTER